MDRFTTGIIAALCLSGGALAVHFAEPGLLTANATATDVSGDEEESDEGGNLDDAEDLVAADDCSGWQDLRDPLRDHAASVAQDDEIAEAVSSDAAFVREFITRCSEQAAKAGATVEARRISYAIARFELMLDRKYDAFSRLKSIAPNYPSAAWRLAESMTAGEPPTSDSATFEDVMTLLESAHRGGETRGDETLLRMIQMVIPVKRLEMPSLVASVYYSGRVPDSKAARMALLSLFDGYTSYCSQWETFAISPADAAEVNNARVALQVDSYIRAWKSLPEWSRNVGEWVKGIGNNSLEGILQDWNSGMATPAQTLFLVNTAAYRDGWRQAETMKCTGPRASRLINNLITMLRARRSARPTDANDADLRSLVQQPDVMSMI